jgi:hypothetical protein
MKSRDVENEPISEMSKGKQIIDRVAELSESLLWF